MKNSMIGGQSSTGPKIDIKNTTAVKCEECECEYFVQATQFRKASRLLTGNSKDTMIPIPTMRCADCGNVNEDFKIQEL
jgi:hypothetical protein